MDQTQLNACFELLKNAVKDSHIPKQRHIDLSIPMATERYRYEEALRVIVQAVKDGTITDAEMKKRLGLL